MSENRPARERQETSERRPTGLQSQNQSINQSQNHTLPDDEPNPSDRFRDMQDSDQEKKRRSRKHNIQKSENEKRVQQTPPYPAQQRTPSVSKPVRKFRHIDRERRSTLHPIEKTVEEETQTFLRLIDHSVDSPMKLFVRNIEQLRANVSKDPKDWWNSIKAVIENLNGIEGLLQKHVVTIAHQDRSLIIRKNQIEELKSKLTDSRVQLTVARNSIKKISQLKNEIIRIRSLKDMHRHRCDQLSEEMTSLKMNKTNLKKKIQSFEDHRRRQPQKIEENFDTKNYKRSRKSFMSTRNEQKRGFRGQLFFIRSEIDYLSNNPPPTFRQARGLRFDDDRVDDLQPKPRYNRPRPKKYSKLPEFYEIQEKWERWKNHLKAKLHVDEWQFISEQHKISFAREHTRSLAYEIIKHRAETDSDDLYVTIDELILDLKQAFEKKNKESKMIDELFNSHFRMSFKNKNETFDEFFIRFNNLAVSIKLSVILKIKTLRDKLIERMRFRMSHLKMCKNWNEFIENCRGVYEDNEDLNDYKNSKPIVRDESLKTGSSSKRKARSHSRSRSMSKSPNQRRKTRKIWDEYRLSRFPVHIEKKLKTEGRCFKCLKKDHLPFDKNALCQHEKPASKKETQIEFVKMGVEWNDVNEEGYQSKYTDSDCSSFHNHSKN